MEIEVPHKFLSQASKAKATKVKSIAFSNEPCFLQFVFHSAW